MDLININVGSGLLLAVLGICIVFVGLIFLIIVIFVLSKVVGLKKAPAPAVAGVAPAPAPVPLAPTTPAPAPAAPVVKKGIGKSEGTIDIGDVHPRTAAMLMAIVADEAGVSIGELDFKSIKEIDGSGTEEK